MDESEANAKLALIWAGARIEVLKAERDAAIAERDASRKAALEMEARRDTVRDQLEQVVRERDAATAERDVLLKQATDLDWMRNQLALLQDILDGGGVAATLAAVLEERDELQRIEEQQSDQLVDVIAERDAALALVHDAFPWIEHSIYEIGDENEIPARREWMDRALGLPDDRE